MTTINVTLELMVFPGSVGPSSSSLSRRFANQGLNKLRVDRGQPQSPSNIREGPAFVVLIESGRYR
jgi:hypothetical protein